jgi:hypothetical protein
MLKSGFELSKNKWGLTSAYSFSLSLHTGDLASLTTAGELKLTPRESRGILFGGGGGKQTTGVVQPPAIQTLVKIGN